MKNTMFTAEMIAPCGLDCSICRLAQAEVNPCPGCHGPNENKPAFCAEKCGIVLCRKRIENGYTFCDECPDYPCEDVMEKENRYTSKYPLYESPLKNLRDIRENGMEKFLEIEREQWTCRECVGVICVHTGECSGCGKHYGAKIVQMDEHTWCIEDDGVRIFLLEGNDKALLIDSGMNLRHVRQIAEGLTDRPVSLLNTHADLDHIGCNGQFPSFYMHPADEENYRRSDKGGQLIPVRDGDTIDLGSRKLKIIHLPGHTPGSIAVLDIDRRVLISGDSIQEHGQIYMFGEFRDLRKYVGSMEKLDAMTSEFDEIWPAHAELPLHPDTVRRHRDGAVRILDHEISGKALSMYGQTVIAYDLGFTIFLCDENI